MKSIIDGVTLEGTPDEIFEYQRLLTKNKKENEYQKFQYDIDKFWNIDKNDMGIKPYQFYK